jgi:hypothetical protein
MIAIAGNAIEAEYPITSNEIADLCRELDEDCGGIYKSRNIEKEAENALKYAFR